MMDQGQESECIHSCQMSLSGDVIRICFITFFEVVEDFVTELTRDSLLSELLYSDDLVLMCAAIEGFCNDFIKWK